jgi:hypothetical protein
VLDDLETSLRDRETFFETTTLRPKIPINIPEKLVSAVETFLSPILSVAQLPKLGERLDLLSQDVAKLIAVHIPAFGGYGSYVIARLFIRASARRRAAQTIS